MRIMKQMMAAVLSALLVLGTTEVPGAHFSAYAAQEKITDGILITEIDPLEQDIAEQTVEVGAKKSAVRFPKTLTAGTDADEISVATPSNLSDKTDASSDKKSIYGVKWEVDPNESSQGEFSSENAGEEFYFLPVIPERYHLEDGIDLPVIHVTVQEKDAEGSAEETVTDKAAKEQSANAAGAAADKEVIVTAPAVKPVEGMPAFSAEKSIDGVKIAVTAEEGVFPKDAVLKVEKVSAEEEQLAETLVSEQREEDRTVAVSYTFDIKVTDQNGNELQPADGGKVNVSFTMAEAADPNLEADVYHITDRVADAEEQVAGGSAESGELSAEKLDSTVNADAEMITAESSGFSIYKVEFSYPNRTYLCAQESVLLSYVMKQVGLSGTVSEKPVNGASFTVIEEGSDYRITFKGGSFAEEDLVVKISSVEHKIRLKYANTTSGTWKNKKGQDMSWVYDAGTGTLTLSGNGELSKPGQGDDFGLDKSAGGGKEYIPDWIPEVPWKAYHDEIETIVLKPGITKIGAQAFRKHTKLKTVTVEGDTLTQIGKDVFYYCKSLKTLDLRNWSNLTDIGTNNEGVFAGSALETLLLPTDLTVLTPGLLSWDNSTLKEVNFSQLTALKKIDKEAVKWLNNSVELKDLDNKPLDLATLTNLEIIGDGAFRNQKLKSDLTVASPNLKIIGMYAFRSDSNGKYRSLETVDLSACTRLKEIKANAFECQKDLSSFKFPNAYTWINKNAFVKCDALNLTTSASIAYCIGGNGALYNVNTDGSADKVLYDGEDKLYWIPTAAAGSDPMAASYDLPCSGAEQPLVKEPMLLFETGEYSTGSYSIQYKLDGTETGEQVPKAKGPGTYTVWYKVTLPDKKAGENPTTKEGTITVTITTKPLADSMLSLDTASFEYDAADHAPVLTVKDGDAVLTEGTDYTVDADAVKTAAEVGSYTIKVTGKGGYTGSASIGWSIADTTPPVISGATEGTTYDKAVSFTVTDLRLASATLQKDSETPQDLTVSAGSASGNATDNGGYQIVAKDLSGNETKLSFMVTILEPTPTPTPAPEPTPAPAPEPAPAPVISQSYGSDSNDDSSESFSTNTIYSADAGAAAGPSQQVLGVNRDNPVGQVLGVNRDEAAERGTWLQEGEDWYYIFPDGQRAVNEWVYLEYNGVSAWYYFGPEGKMMTGWLNYKGYQYYLNPVSDGFKGRMQTGWAEITQNWYFFETDLNNNQGHLYKNELTPDGYRVGPHGTWMP